MVPVVVAWTRSRRYATVLHVCPRGPDPDDAALLAFVTDALEQLRPHWVDVGLAHDPAARAAATGQRDPAPLRDVVTVRPPATADQADEVEPPAAPRRGRLLR